MLFLSSLIILYLMTATEPLEVAILQMFSHNEQVNAPSTPLPLSPPKKYNDICLLNLSI